MRFLLLVFSSLFLAACGHIPITLSHQEVERLGTIGVVTIVEDRIVLKHVGTTAFSNSESEFDVDWGINQFILDNVLNEFAKVKNLRYVVPKYEMSTLKGYYSSTVKTPYFDYDINNIKEHLKDLAKENSLDAILLISSSISSDIVASTSQTVHGQGLYLRTFGPYESLRLYVLAKMLLVNGKTLEPLAHRLLFTREEAQGITWKKNYVEYSDSEKNALEKRVKEVYKIKISEQIQKIGLVD